MAKMEVDKLFDHAHNLPDSELVRGKLYGHVKNMCRQNSDAPDKHAYRTHFYWT